MQGSGLTRRARPRCRTAPTARAVLLAGLLALCGGWCDCVPGWIDHAQASGSAGNALRFDGQNDVVRVPYHATLDLSGTLTLEAWIRPDSTQAGGIAGMWGNGGLADKFLLYLENDQVHARLVVEGVAGQTTVSTPVPAGQWSHVAMVYDGAELLLFVNGVQEAAQQISGAIPEVTLAFRMGIEDMFVPGPPQFFEGEMDEMRLWSVPRSVSEIANDFNCPVDPTTPGLVAYWRFDGATGTQEVIDLVTGNSTGTLGSTAAAAADDPFRITSGAPFGLPSFTAFLRGDCDGSGGVNLADVVLLLGILFPAPGTPPTPHDCPDSCDGDDSGGLSLPDAVVTLAALFGQPPTPLPAPYPACDLDPTAADGLDCAQAPPCP